MTIANKKSYEAPAIRLIALRYQTQIMGGSGNRSLQVKTNYDDDEPPEQEGKRAIYNLGW